MRTPIVSRRIDSPRVLVATLLATAGVLLGGCGGGTESGGGGGAPVQPTTYAVRATVSGLEGAGLTLRLNGETLQVASSGVVAFTTRLGTGSAYSVSVQASPVRPSQSCSLANGSGTVQSADIANINVTCTTQGIAQQSTLVTIDTGVAQAATPLIARVLSPTGAGQAGQWVDIPTTSPSGYALIMGVDSAGSPVLAALTNGSGTTLTARSTASTLTLLALAGQFEATQIAAIVSQIESAPSFNNLVAAVQAALQLGLVPGSAPAVLDAVLVVSSSVLQTRLQGSISSVRAHAITTNYLDSPYVVVPDVVIPGAALDLYPLGILSNRTPLYWDVTTTSNVGVPLGRRVFEPFDLARGITVNYTGTNLLATQTPETLKEAAWVIADDVIDVAFSFIPTPTGCSPEIVKTFAKAAWKSQGQLLASADSFLESMRAIVFSPTAVWGLGAQCLGTESARAQASEIYAFLSKFKKLVAAAKGARAIATFTYLVAYYDRTSPTVEVCFRESGALTNCVRTLEFESTQLNIAAGGGVRPLTLTAFGPNNAPTAMPFGAGCRLPLPVAFLTVNRSTCEVSVNENMIFNGGPYRILSFPRFS